MASSLMENVQYISCIVPLHFQRPPNMEGTILNHYQILLMKSPNGKSKVSLIGSIMAEKRKNNTVSAGKATLQPITLGSPLLMFTLQNWWDNSYSTSASCHYKNSMTWARRCQDAHKFFSRRTIWINFQVFPHNYLFLASLPCHHSSFAKALA